MVRQVSSGQTPDIMEVKDEVTKIKRMVTELYNTSVIPKGEVMIVVPNIHVEGIWAIPKLVVEET